jgi:hypothetical protein
LYINVIGSIEVRSPRHEIRTGATGLDCSMDTGIERGQNGGNAGVGFAVNNKK